MELMVGYAVGRVSKAEYLRAAFSEVESSRRRIRAVVSGGRTFRRVVFPTLRAPSNR